MGLWGLWWIIVVTLASFAYGAVRTKIGREWVEKRFPKAKRHIDPVIFVAMLATTVLTGIEKWQLESHNAKRNLGGKEPPADVVTREYRPTVPVSVSVFVGNAEANQFGQSIINSIHLVGNLRTTTISPNAIVSAGGDQSFGLRINSVQIGDDDAMKGFADWMDSLGYKNVFEQGQPANTILIGSRSFE